MQQVHQETFSWCTYSTCRFQLGLTSSEVGHRVVDELPALVGLGDIGGQDEDDRRAKRQRVVGDLPEARLPSRH